MLLADQAIAYQTRSSVKDKKTQKKFNHKSNKNIGGGIKKSAIKTSEMTKEKKISLLRGNN